MNTNNLSNARVAADPLLDGVTRPQCAIRSISPSHIGTGFPELNRFLPGAGWPVTALTELFHAQAGMGELRLLLPALNRLSRLGRWIAIIAPPFTPYAPALAAMGLDLSRVLLVHPKTQHDALNAIAQGLASGTCGAVLAWPKQIDQPALQHLHAAATAGRSWGVLFRHPDCYAQPSPAALRLHLRNCNGATRVAIKQSEGGLADAELVMELSRRTAVVPQPATPHAPAPLQRRRQQPSGERSRSVPAPRQPESAQLDLPFA